MGSEAGEKTVTANKWEVKPTPYHPSFHNDDYVDGFESYYYKSFMASPPVAVNWLLKELQGRGRYSVHVPNRIALFPLPEPTAIVPADRLDIDFIEWIPYRDMVQLRFTYDKVQAHLDVDCLRFAEAKNIDQFFLQLADEAFNSEFEDELPESKFLSW